MTNKAMTDHKKECKTFFAQWGPPTLLCGMFVVFGISAFFTASLKPGYSGVSDLFHHGAGYAFMMLIILGILFWVFFFRWVRFEKTYAVIYYCTVFPVRVNYSEITCLTCSYQKYKKQAVPYVIHIHLRSGRIKSWDINLFSPQTANAVKSELEKRIDFPVNQQEIPDIGSWANNALRTSNTVKIIWCAAAILPLGLGAWEMAEQIVWDQHIKTWDKVDGIILKNTVKRVSSGKRSKEVADVEYRYLYKGRQYHGTRIVYDSKTFPELKVGSKRQVIVNPEKPRECAIMFWYRGNWGFIRWIKCVFLYLVSLGFAIVFCRTIFQKKIIIPETLKNYMISIPPERFYAALDIERSAVALNNIELRQKMEYRQNFRYGIIRQTASKFAYIIWGIVFLLAVVISVFIPLCWIMAVIIGLTAYKMYAPRMTVFDFQEKKFFCCRSFNPEKAAKMNTFPFAKVNHLCCNTLWTRNSDRYIGVFAVTHDGYKLPLFKVTRKHLELLLELLPELAEKMGNIPITY